MMVTRKLAVYLALLLLVCGIGKISSAPAPPTKSQKTTAAHPTPKRTDLIDDSLALPPARDLNLSIEGGHKAEALAHFAEGIDFEEDGEMEKALEAYRQVLNVDPGQIELAVRVAALLTRDDDYPSAIDVLKDAVKVHPKAPEPYLELSFIYAKYLKKVDQAIEFANKAIALDPQKIDGYQRLFEIYLTAGDEKGRSKLSIAPPRCQTTIRPSGQDLAGFTARLFLKPDAKPNPEQTARLNDVFEKAAAKGQDNAAVLKEVGDYFASTQQIKEALPFYLRVLELQPDDAQCPRKTGDGLCLNKSAGPRSRDAGSDHPRTSRKISVLRSVEPSCMMMKGAPWFVLIKPIRQMPSSRRRRRTTNKACSLIQITRRRICGWRNYCSFR